MKRWLLGAAALVVALLVLQVGLALKHREDLVTAPERTSPPSAASVAHSPISPSQVARSPSSRLSAAQPAQVENLRRKYGPDLEITFASTGGLAVLRSVSGAPAPAGFDPNDPQAVSRRAREVLKDVKPLLGLDPGSDLGQPLIRASTTLAQVEFPQTLNGVPISPASGVSMDLGSHGEVLGVYAQAWSGVAIANARTLDSAQARSNLEGRWEGGRSVVYVTAGAQEGQGAGRYAFEFYSRSERVVLDASNGRVLERRDIRHF